jgi:peptidyl-prolyl cis-trans isomerase D
MISQLRKFTKGWVATGFVVLIGVAFAIWGMPNMFSAANRPLAKVDGQAIGRAEIQRAFDMLLRGQQEQGQTVTSEQAIQAGFHRQAIESLIFQNAVFHFAQRLGMDASDAQVGEMIRGYPGFQDAFDMSGQGGFDPVAYRRAIADAGYSVPEFEEIQRRLIASNQLLDALSVGARAPRSFGAFRLAFESERRALAVAEITPARIGAIAAPTDEQLTTFYTQQARNWQLPELRTLTIVLADPTDFASRVTVPEEQIQREFDRRKDQYATPETRTLVQLVFQDEASARTAAQRLTAGGDPAALSTELGGQLIEHNAVAPAAIPDQAVREAAFAMAAGAPAQAVQGQLAPWSAIRLTSIVAGQAADLATARAQIREEIVTNESRQLTQDAMTEFDQQRRRRVPFAEAAAAVGFRVVRAEKIAANGFTLQGQPGVTGVSDPMPVLEAAFTQRQGRPTDWMRMQDGTEAIVQIESIDPARAPPLAEVREEVTQAWRLNEMDTRMRALADEVVAAVAGGQTFEEAARTRNLRSSASPDGLNRQEAFQVLGQGLAPQVFAARENGVIYGYRLTQTEQGVVPLSDALVLVHVRTISRADLAQSGTQIDALRTREDRAYARQRGPEGMVPQSLQQALGVGIGDAIRQAARVEENQEAIESMFPVAQGQPGS